MRYLIAALMMVVGIECEAGVGISGGSGGGGSINGSIPLGNIVNLNSNQVVQYDYPANANTNPIGMVYSGFSQGIANDGANIYEFQTAGIGKWVYTNRTLSSFLFSISGVQMTNGLDNYNGFHSGDGDYYGGYIFDPLEATVGGNFPLGTTNLGIAIYDAVSGGNLYKYFSVSNYQREISSVTVGIVSNSPTVFAAAYLGLGTATSNNTVFEYSTSNLTNLTFVKALTLNTNLCLIQGLKFAKGKLYALCDQQTGFGTQVDGARLFEIDVTNETARLVTEVSVPNQTEWEGLDYYTGTTNMDDPGFAIAAEGSTGAWIYNWFGIPTVTSNQVFTGKFVGDISQTWGQINAAQLPGSAVVTNSSAGFQNVYAQASGFASYLSGYSQSDVGYWTLWNNKNGLVSLGGRLGAPYSTGNNSPPGSIGGAAFYTWDTRNSMTVFGNTNEEVNLPGAVISNTNAIFMGALQFHPIANAPAFSAIQKTNDVFIWESNSVTPMVWIQYYAAPSTLTTVTHFP